jgi:uncharacterized protein YggE
MAGRVTRSLPLAYAVSMSLLASAGAAEPELSSFNVTASATVAAKPDVVELVGVVSGQSHLAGDAVAKFRSAKQTALDALQGLGVPGLQIQTRGFSIGIAVPAAAGIPMALRAQLGHTEEKPMVAVQETVKIRIQGIDKLDADALLNTIVKVVDAGQEAGITFARPLSDVERISSRGAPQAFTAFLLQDTEQLRQRALQLAVERARAEARGLAALANLQLGDVMSVQEVKPLAYIPSALKSSGEEPAATSSEIQLTVTLTVNFKLKRP